MRIQREYNNIIITGSSSGTWANMVECLHQAQLNYLASIIEAMYEYGRYRYNDVDQ